MKKFYFLIAIFSIAATGSAQAVSFTAQPYGTGSYNPCAVDMNGDFLDDIVTVQSNQLKIYHQQVGGGFVSTTYPVTGLGVGNVTPDWSIAAGDYDADGLNDLVFGNGSRISVVKANTAGTAYTFMTYPQNIFSQRTNFIDIDNDGHLDLFACHDVDQSHAYRNDGTGALTFDISLMPTLDVGGNYASIWIDYDNDNDMDMYMAKCRGGAPVGDPQRINLMYQNNGDGTFTEVGDESGTNDGAQSWSTAFADFDNDGDLDFILSNISDENRFYLNNGDGTFTDIYSTTGIGSQVGSWEIQAADFNNDGFVDFFWENSTEMYLNNGDLTFTGQSMAFGQGAVADLNNDGFLDVQRGGTVYYNDGNANKWLTINLQGIMSNRNGIGARVEIYGAWGKQIREVRSGEGFSNMSTLNVHFGLGTATDITSVIVRWPSGTVDEIINPSTNQNLFVLEGSSPQLGVASNELSQFSLYPIPANDSLNIRFNDATVISTADIFDLNGKVVRSAAVVDQTISVQDLATGTYIVRLRDSNGNEFSQKFMKN